MRESVLSGITNRTAELFCLFELTTEDTAQHSRNQMIFFPQRLLEPLMDTDKLKTLGRAAWERQFPHWQDTRENAVIHVCI
jgi:hypothetical protein